MSFLDITQFLRYCCSHSLYWLLAFVTFCFITGRPARSVAMPVLFLLTGPKMGFSPRRGDTLPR